MSHADFLKLTENRNTRNQESRSLLRMQAVDKLVEKHFSIRQFKFRARRNSSHVKGVCEFEVGEPASKKQESLLEPLVLKPSQNRIRPKPKWPLNNFLKSYNIDTPKQIPQPLK